MCKKSQASCNPFKTFVPLAKIAFELDCDLQLEKALQTPSFAKALKTSMDNSPDTNADNHLQDTFVNPEKSSNRVSWVRRHGLIIVLMTAAFAYFMTQYNALPVIMVVVGISLLIFVHELGHFLVAKWCDVHVLTFSIGLGPAIPGCSFRWGETTYKLGMIPLGGYVKMVGEGADEKDDNDDPR
jgi:hypothetical protein